jgi:hypothetical protein
VCIMYIVLRSISNTTGVNLCPLSKLWWCIMGPWRKAFDFVPYTYAHILGGDKSPIHLKVENMPAN